PVRAGPADIDPLADVRALGVDAAVDLAGVGGEPDLLTLGRVLGHVPDLADHVAHELVDRLAGERGLGRDLPGDDRQVRGYPGLARHPAGRIVLQAGVEDRVRNL